MLQGASIPAVRPGRKTAEYITDTLMYMSVLGSVFLGLLAVRTYSTDDCYDHYLSLRNMCNLRWADVLLLSALDAQWLLQAAPAAVEAITKLTAFRGFAGTSVLIIVGVATDTARKVSLPFHDFMRPQFRPLHQFSVTLWNSYRLHLILCVALAGPS